MGAATHSNRSPGFRLPRARLAAGHEWEFGRAYRDQGECKTAFKIAPQFCAGEAGLKRLGLLGHYLPRPQESPLPATYTNVRNTKGEYAFHATQSPHGREP